MQLQKVTVERAKEIACESCGLIEFKIIDGNIKGATLRLASGPLIMEYSDYNLQVTEPARRKVYTLSFMTDVCGDKVMIEKTFKDEYDRRSFIGEHCRGMGDDELTLEDYEVLCD